MSVDSPQFDPIPFEQTEDSQLKFCQPVKTTDSSTITLQNLESTNLSNLLDDPTFLPYKPRVNANVSTLIKDVVSQVLDRADVDYEIPEPTPIGPNRIDIVDKVSIAATSWCNDESFFSSLHSLLIAPECESLSFYKDIQIQSSWFTVDSSVQANINTDQSAEDNQSCNLNDSKGYAERWNERYQDLVEFQLKYKHCLVPLNWPSNPSLGHWVKRQRYQYSLKLNGIHSTLTKDREEALDKLGFVWDSHSALWEERWNELRSFRERHGHCHVPSRYPENPKLSVWVKCQRRQFKLLSSGQKSNITQDRINKLRDLEFVFDPRKRLK